MKSSYFLKGNVEILSFSISINKGLFYSKITAFVTLSIEFIVMILYVAWAVIVVKSGKGTTSMVWGSEVLYGIGMGVLSAFYLRYGNWRKTKV